MQLSVQILYDGVHYPDHTGKLTFLILQKETFVKKAFLALLITKPAMPFSTAHLAPIVWYVADRGHIHCCSHKFFIVDVRVYASL